MTQHNSVNVKLSNLQLNELKLAIKNGTEVTLKLPSKLIDDSNDKISVPHKFISS